MITKYSKYSTNQKMVIGILTILAVTNAGWVIICKSYGPLIALMFYVFAIFLFWQKNDIFSGIIIGMIGLAVHIYELIFQGIIDLEGLEMIFFFINLIFPIPLVYFSYKVYKKIKQNGKKSVNHFQ